MFQEILNPEFKVGTLNSKTFESGEFCRVNDFLSNPDVFPPANFWVRGRIKMADLVMLSHLESHWWKLIAVAGYLILLQVQAIFYNG